MTGAGPGRRRGFASAGQPRSTRWAGKTGLLGKLR